MLASMLAFCALLIIGAINIDYQRVGDVLTGTLALLSPKLETMTLPPYPDLYCFRLKFGLHVGP
jgi:hypothetical protein